MTLSRAAFLVCLALPPAMGLVACVQRIPMGLSQSQWDSLGPEKQAEYLARQYEIDEHRKRDEQSQRNAEDYARQKAMSAERERVDGLYANAAYRDIVRVLITGGALDIYGKSRPAAPAALEIAKGERKHVTINQEGRVRQSFDFPVYLSPDGQTLTFDDGSANAFVMVNKDWERGQSYTMPSSPRKGRITLLGASVFVKFRETADAPQRVIIEHR